MSRHKSLNPKKLNLNPHIVISQKNYDKLKNLGKMHETFDDVITRLLEERK